MSDQLTWFLTFCIWGGSAGGTDGGGISIAGLNGIGGGGGGLDSIESAGDGGAGIAGRNVAVAYMAMLSSVEALIRLAAVEGLALLQPRSPQQLEIASLLPPPMLSPQQLEIESLLSQKK